MITKTHTATTYGIDVNIVSIEVSIVQGIGLSVTGLADNVIKESQYRIESALKHIKCAMPRQRVIINLAPADLKKVGSGYDLPIALCILQASSQRCFLNLDKYIILGELSLDGFLRPIKGSLATALTAQKQGFTDIILPASNVSEAAVVDGVNIIPVEHINDAIEFLSGVRNISPVKIDGTCVLNDRREENDLDFADIQGHEDVKRALEISAAGGHNLIMVGPPGVGKTMLAKRIPSILPPMTLNEALETTCIYSVAGKLKSGSIMTTRPFRSPHHTITYAGLIGGGSIPQPGEISLAHNGVLFLDELPEFMRSVLEVMRQPLEERSVTISRAQMTVSFPANFMLIASMNPCPCGYYNHPTKQCVCPNGAIQKYLNKISGPLLDRIDLHIQVSPVSYDIISSGVRGERSVDIQRRVIKARERQISRFGNSSIYTNAMISTSMIRDMCPISSSGRELIKIAMEKLGLSARAYSRIIKVARTIADLDDKDNISDEHISEAIHYRSLDRNNWGVNY